VASACAFGWLVLSLTHRLPDYGEACVLFAASRVRSGYALYIDPLIGAYDYGPVPSRTFVPYTPLYPVLLAGLPSTIQVSGSRACGSLIFAAMVVRILRCAHRREDSTPADGTLAADCKPAPNEREGRMLATWAVTLFATGVFDFGGWLANAKPEAIALGCVIEGFLRALRMGRVGHISALLFALGFFFKPSFLGLGLGCLLAGATLSPRGWKPVLSYGSAMVFGVGLLTVVTSGQFVPHMRAALGFVFFWQRLVDEFTHQAPFMAGAFAVAVACILSTKTWASRCSAIALGSSTFFLCTGLLKVGSSSN
jgi:hypothetical protein